MADSREFDNISAPNKPAEKNNEQQVQPHDNTLQNITRVLAVLPCFPAYTPRPNTPNIDQLKEIFQKFKRQDPNQIDVDMIERSKTNDLCEWTNKVLTFLPSVEDAPESNEQTKNITTHFNTIKKFYNVAQTTGIESQELDTFFNAVQIYESVMSVAFVMFDEHPDTLKAITENVQSAIGQCEGHGQQGCMALVFCGAALLSKFNTLLGSIDSLLGQFGMVRVAEFVAQIIEVFSKFFNIDLRDTQKLTALSDSVQDMVRVISGALRSVFGDSIPSTGRSSKWGPLDITERIRSKLSKFEKDAPIVGRTVGSFEKFFAAVEKIDDNFEKSHVKSQQAVRTAAAVSDDGYMIPITHEDDEDFRKVQAPNSLAAQIENKQVSALEEVKGVAKIFQHLETILSYGVLLFKNEDDVLNPLLDNVDECTRILQKFTGLHPLYQVLLGTNYLSKIKVIVKKIMALLENSGLKINSPKEFLSELRQKYPDLLYMLCESYLNENMKKKLEFLPDPLENALNNALDGTLNKFKKFF